ncbi:MULTISPECIES: sugar ABC transporter ATP-binding protein [unclassified Leptolyngbya]|uniref:sugar ABC transporter ATP-binding protein n=1 Tax=unclassified Leptolyngbya TaxID=2650499 RepID=UPI001686118C|nr:MULTISPECIES: sugar ABC transporter ATP-binding protein [unclassified Leptolyngbya]MBD1911435.1 sugar ABC transporter ATP-binding protein [Leptolyngbya sp. FACHB-8]MBD2153447.1 sugar ABC transporter ATP-binding protein [Leptolyngbya sp. FACHB-16]
MTDATHLGSTAPVLEMRGISKQFFGFSALRNVNLTVYPGEVHALMGENGAGKSTLMKILAGAYSADSGEILINGQPTKITHPSEARAAGITLIYQELNVAPNLTVAENIFMGQERTRAGLFLQRDQMYQEAEAILESLGASFSPKTTVSTLSIAEQQQIEIARALKDKSRILVMDEPTAALSDRETERLFGLIRRLRDDGIAIIYISHRMEEVYALADRVSVLRDGEYVGSLEHQTISADRLVQMMVGRPLQDFYEHESHASMAADEAPLLQVVDLTDGREIGPASFNLYAGEILGLAGLVGAGRTELARLIFGADPRSGGEVYLQGRRLHIDSPVDALRVGIAYVPEDRKDQGLFLEMSSHNNITMNVLGQRAKAGVMNLGFLKNIAADAIEQLGIRLASPNTRAVDLSGGNQQKLLLARWLAIKPKVLLLDEPTRGVDIGAKSEIYRIISDLAAQGVGILMISSELPEVIGMSDRVLVMREGRLVGEVGGTTGEAITQENIMVYATGAREMNLA